MNDPLLRHFDNEYSAAVRAQLEKGGQEYALETGRAAAVEAIREIRAELADLVGWGCKLDFILLDIERRTQEAYDAATHPSAHR